MTETAMSEPANADPRAKAWFEVGDYGESTVQACAAFHLSQSLSGSDADGIAGPQTVARLGLVWIAD